VLSVASFTLRPCAGRRNHANTTGTISTATAGLNGADYVYGDTSTTVVWPEVGARGVWIVVWVCTLILKPEADGGGRAPTCGGSEKPLEVFVLLALSVSP
jgi:hypothetical protein